MVMTMPRTNRPARNPSAPMANKNFINDFKIKSFCFLKYYIRKPFQELGSILSGVLL